MISHHKFILSSDNAKICTHTTNVQLSGVTETTTYAKQGYVTIDAIYKPQSQLIQFLNAAVHQASSEAYYVTWNNFHHFVVVCHCETGICLRPIYVFVFKYNFLSLSGCFFCDQHIISVVCYSLPQSPSLSTDNDLYKPQPTPSYSTYQFRSIVLTCPGII